VLGVVTIAGIREDRAKGRALLTAAIGSSLSVLLMAFATNITLGLAAAFVMGMFQAPFMSLSNAFIQAVVPDAIRGRVSSLFTMSALSLMALANLGYGWLTDLYSSASVLAVPAGAFFAVVLIALLLVGPLRTIFLQGFSAVVPEPSGAPAPAPSGGSK
jgi:MFS family permease